MKHRLLLAVAAGVVVASGTAVWVLACDKDAKSATAAVASSSHECSAQMAAQCTAAQAATCSAHKMKASAVTASTCSGHGAAAMTAQAGQCPYSKGATFTTADAKGSGACSHRAATMAAGSSCSVHGAAAVTASTAGYKGSCAHDGKSAVAAGSGASCGGRGMMATADRGVHHDCDACNDMADCDGELKASGAMTQVVKLKNGIMYVYTTQDPGKARMVQTAVNKRYERLKAMNTAGEKTKLCPECKTMRGAMASGKLTREVVTIDGGCMTLVTSSDRTIVAKLHSMVEQHQAGHARI